MGGAPHGGTQGPRGMEGRTGGREADRRSDTVSTSTPRRPVSRCRSRSMAGQADDVGVAVATQVRGPGRHHTPLDPGTLRGAIDQLRWPWVRCAGDGDERRGGSEKTDQ